MPILKVTNSKASLSKALNYVEKTEKTDGGKLVGSLNCDVRSAKEEFEQVKNFYNKKDGRQYKHYILSFDPKADKQPTPTQAVAICQEIVQSTPHLQGFQSVIAVHTDRDHIHAHIIVNSVSLIDGHKLNESKADFMKMREIQDEISQSYGFEKPKEREQGLFRSSVTKTYQAVKKNGQNSDYVKIAQNYYLAQECCSMTEFAAFMKKRGITVNYSRSRKYMSFELNGKKYRDSRLAKMFGDPNFSKNQLEKTLEKNSDLKFLQMILGKKKERQEEKEQQAVIQQVEEKPERQPIFEPPHPQRPVIYEEPDYSEEDEEEEEEEISHGFTR